MGIPRARALKSGCSTTLCYEIYLKAADPDQEGRFARIRILPKLQKI